jgi:hypothetical protein
MNRVGLWGGRPAGSIRWRAVGIALYVIGLFYVLLVAAPVAARAHTTGLRMLGWVCASIAIILLVSVAHRWVKLFPGILLYATLNAAHRIPGGRVLAYSELPMPWQAAVAMTLLFAAITVSS